MDIIITKRLTLRSPLEVDAEALATALSNPNVARDLSAVPQPYSLSDAFTWIADNQSASGKCTYTIHRERLIGAIGVHAPKDNDTPAMLGYWLDEPSWNNGFMTEAARAVLARAFRTMQLNEIGCRAVDDNIGSHKVMEKLGFEPSGESDFSSPLRGDRLKAKKSLLTRAAFETRFGALDEAKAA